MKTNELLIEARRLIEKPENWLQRTYARDTDGTPVPDTDPSACRFCSKGALYAAAFRNRVDEDEEDKASKALDAAVGGRPFVKFNDTHTHAEVLAAFDRAIEATK